MRDPFEDTLNNSLARTFNSQRNYINQEINRLASVQARETVYRRSGMLDFGGLQMINLISSELDFAIVGGTIVSPIVAP